MKIEQELTKSFQQLTGVAVWHVLFFFCYFVVSCFFLLNTKQTKTNKVNESVFENAGKHDEQDAIFEAAKVFFLLQSSSSYLHSFNMKTYFCHEFFEISCRVSSKTQLFDLSLRLPKGKRNTTNNNKQHCRKLKQSIELENCLIFAPSKPKRK